jgi:CheY-like chemotaxis protein/anti-sigma regulatory factor (Ser/Thr protein kinase)
MLNFSRQTEQKRTPLDIVPIIKEALKLLRPSIPATIEIFSDLNAGKNIVLADPTKMHQVVVNLCTNAYQAMETKGGKLSIELKPVKIDEETSKNYLDLKAGEYLKLSITDTGNGMDARTRDRIFEPFFTTKEVNQGTGLGLAVVHGIVQSHEGTITVYSEPGEGSTFNVFLPVFSDQGNVEQTREPENFLPGTESILIVDDKVSVTKILEKMLDTLGYKTTIVNSSNQGLKLFEKNPDSFNMLITDLTMPELTGLELSRKIHQIRRGLPIIMITGYGNKLSRKEQEAAGITKLIGKPVLMGEISQLVRDLFDRMENE